MIRMDALDGRIAIITGASSGIGYATAHLFARAGARLVLVARRKRCNIRSILVRRATDVSMGFALTRFAVES